MKKLLILFALATTLSACNTTGDPMHGGLFFNYGAAQQRIEEKQAHLYRLESEQQALRGVR